MVAGCLFLKGNAVVEMLFTETMYCFSFLLGLVVFLGNININVE